MKRLALLLPLLALAAALGAAVLLAGRLFPRLVPSDAPAPPRAYTEPAQPDAPPVLSGLSFYLVAEDSDARARALVSAVDGAAPDGFLAAPDDKGFVRDPAKPIDSAKLRAFGDPPAGQICLIERTSETLYAPIFVEEPPAMRQLAALRSCEADTDARGRHFVYFQFGKRDARAFADVTEANARKPDAPARRLAIVVGDAVLFATRFQEPIRNGRGLIFGSFSRDEAERLAALLGAADPDATGTQPFVWDLFRHAEVESHAESAIPDWTEYFMAMDAFVEPDCVNDTNVWSEAFFTDFDAFRDALLAAIRNRDGEAFAGLVDERHRAGIRGPDGRCDVFDKAYFRRLEPAGRSDVLLRRIGPDDRNRLLAATPDETNRVGRMFVCIVSRPGGNGPALSLPVLYDRGSFRIASPRGWIRFGEAVPDIVPPGTVFEDGSRVAKADAYPVWVPRFRSPAADALAEALSEALRGDPPPDFTFRWHPLARERATAANAGLAAFRDALAGRELRVRFNAWTPETDPLAGSGLGSSALAEQIGSLQLDAGGFASGSDRRDEQRRRRANRSGNWPGMFPSALEDGLWLEGDVAVVNGGRETPFLLFTAVERPDGCRLLGMQPMDDLLADVSAATATPTVERVARAFLDSLATNATLSRIEAESADFYVPVRPNLRIALERELLPATRSPNDESHAEAAEGAETKSHAEETATKSHAESAEFAE